MFGRSPGTLLAAWRVLRQDSGSERPGQRAEREARVFALLASAVDHRGGSSYKADDNLRNRAALDALAEALMPRIVDMLNGEEQWEQVEKFSGPTATYITGQEN